MAHGTWVAKINVGRTPGFDIRSLMTLFFEAWWVLNGRWILILAKELSKTIIFAIFSNLYQKPNLGNFSKQEFFDPIDEINFQMYYSISETRGQNVRDKIFLPVCLEKVLMMQVRESRYVRRIKCPWAEENSVVKLRVRG